ncbi:hypothetical protein P7K49_032956 [Saguinus oedipus]|uniref:Uncharacterized protein n=1 Tax=Saguinus oedipus TaxID=9490 RepID=A0ABQ9TQJ5_SAGOE|nr:hypothetical protein P7K49_032956 [Saguinus oedipus]
MTLQEREDVTAGAQCRMWGPAVLAVSQQEAKIPRALRGPKLSSRRKRGIGGMGEEEGPEGQRGQRGAHMSRLPLLPAGLRTPALLDTWTPTNGCFIPDVGQQ